MSLTLLENVPYTAQEKLDAIDREIRYRIKVYSRLVETGGMTQDKADFEIGIMRAIALDYFVLAKGPKA